MQTRNDLLSSALSPQYPLPDQHLPVSLPSSCTSPLHRSNHRILSPFFFYLPWLALNPYAPVQTDLFTFQFPDVCARARARQSFIWNPCTLPRLSCLRVLSHQLCVSSLFHNPYILSRRRSDQLQHQGNPPCYTSSASVSVTNRISRSARAMCYAAVLLFTSTHIPARILATYPNSKPFLGKKSCPRTAPFLNSTPKQSSQMRGQPTLPFSLSAMSSRQRPIPTSSYARARSKFRIRSFITPLSLPRSAILA